MDGALAGNKACAGSPPPKGDSTAGEKGEPPGQLSGSGSSIGLNSACECHRDSEPYARQEARKYHFHSGNSWRAFTRK